jgi:hypothetical protein
LAQETVGGAFTSENRAVTPVGSEAGSENSGIANAVRVIESI